MKIRALVSLSVASAGIFCLSAVGCKPRTPTQKVEDKVEDASHEANQGMERAKENVQDATSPNK
jgi:hypothetical protein